MSVTIPEEIVKRLKNLRMKYPHPLDWSTKFTIYGKNIISLNFFPNAWKRWYVTQSDLKNFYQQLNKDLDEINDIKKKLNNENISYWIKTFYQRKIENTIYWLIFIKTAAKIEAEKWGINLLDHTEKKLLSKEIKQLSNLFYWSSIQSNKKELQEVEKFLEDLYTRKKHLLTEKEEENFRNFFYQLIWKNLKEVKTKKPQKIKIHNEEILKKNLDIETIKKIFDIVFEIYWIKENITITKDKDFIDFWESWNFLPANKYYDVERVLRLISHEIETHTLRKRNNIFGISSKKSILREEWLAIFNEEMTVTNNPKKKNVLLINFVTVFASEIFWEKKLKKFLKIYKKMLEQSTEDKDINKIITRRKRYNFQHLPGVNRKDTVYHRGYHKVLNFLSEQENKKQFYQLFESKITPYEIKILEEIPESYKKDIVYPIRVWKLSMLKLTEWQIDFKYLKRNDFRFKKIKNIDQKTLDKIDEITNIIKNS